jgi:hypothetical protein
MEIVILPLQRRLNIPYIASGTLNGTEENVYLYSSESMLGTVVYHISCFTKNATVELRNFGHSAHKNESLLQMMSSTTTSN